MDASGSEVPVADAVVLARFLLQSSWIRAEGTIKPDAFMPPPSLELSVTQCEGPEQAVNWHRGQQVAATRQRTLYGAALITARAVRTVEPLDAVQAPLDEDPLHGHVINWPPSSAKERQKELALELAKNAKKVDPPLPGG